jgi:c-di-GMP-binding flagellar brake protein YcgR
MEKRETRRRKTHNFHDLYANVKIGSKSIKLPIVDISIGGMGVLVSNGFSLFKEGKDIVIDTLEKQGSIIAASISGRIAYIGPGVPSRAGIDFSPADTPIEAYTQLKKGNGKTRQVIKNKEEILHTFNEIKKWSRGFGDMLMIHKHKAIPAEFFYLRPQDDNMVLRIVRISELRLPFHPEVGVTYPFYLFKGVNVMLFSAKVLNIIKNIMETSWPNELQYISRRSMLRYFVTGQEPITAHIYHPISSKDISVVVWDISIEGMGAEILDDDTPFIEGMNLPSIRINLPKGPVDTKGIVRSVRTENVLQKTQLGIEFTEGVRNYQDRILDFILEMKLPSEGVLNGMDRTP